MIGKRLLVGLTYLDRNGEVKEQIQLHGLIKSVSDDTVSFERADGEGDFSIPFDGELDLADEESVYNLRSTGEAVSGVSYIASFTIHQSEESGS